MILEFSVNGPHSAVLLLQPRISLKPCERIDSLLWRSGLLILAMVLLKLELFAPFFKILFFSICVVPRTHTQASPSPVATWWLFLLKKGSTPGTTEPPFGLITSPYAVSSSFRSIVSIEWITVTSHTSRSRLRKVHDSHFSTYHLNCTDARFMRQPTETSRVCDFTRVRQTSTVWQPQ